MYYSLAQAPILLLLKPSSLTFASMRFFCILLASLHVLSLACNETNHVGNEAAWAYKIIVNNSCSKTVQVAIHYKQTGTLEYKTRCWWMVSPYVSSYLMNDGDMVFTENPLWFFHAEEVYGDLVWEGDDHIGTCEYRMLKMKKTSYLNSNGDLSLDLTCLNGVVRAKSKATEVVSGSNSSQEDSIQALPKKEIPGVEGSVRTQELLP